MTDQSALLSIAIPTYNFGHLIGETLASIVSQADQRVEIIVLDGGSTDATSAVVSRWMERCPQLRYVRLAARGGIDQDIQRAVDACLSPVCWLFSADDVMRPGALDTVLQQLNRGIDVHLVTHSDCDATLRIVNERRPILAGGDRILRVANPRQRRAYFAAAQTSEAFFSFLSGLIVTKRAWHAVSSDANLYIGSCWSHAARLLRVMRDDGLVVHHIAAPLVDRRGENDSFDNQGMVKRFALGIDGYLWIVSELFGPDSAEVSETRRVLRRDFTLIMFILARQLTGKMPGQESRPDLDRLFHLTRRGGLATLPARLLYWLPDKLLWAGFHTALLLKNMMRQRT